MEAIKVFALTMRMHIHKFRVFSSIFNGPFNAVTEMKKYSYGLPPTVVDVALQAYSTLMGTGPYRGLCDMIAIVTKVIKTAEDAKTVGQLLVTMFKSNPSSQPAAMLLEKYLVDQFENKILKEDSKNWFFVFDQQVCRRACTTDAGETSILDGATEKGYCCTEGQGGFKESDDDDANKDWFGKKLDEYLEPPPECKISVLGRGNKADMTMRKTMDKVLLWVDKLLKFVSVSSAYYEDQFEIIRQCQHPQCVARANEYLEPFYAVVNGIDLSPGSALTLMKQAFETAADTAEQQVDAWLLFGNQVQEFLGAVEPLYGSIQGIFKPFEDVLDADLSDLLVWPSCDIVPQVPTLNVNSINLNTIKSLSPCTLPSCSITKCTPKKPNCNKPNCNS
jgi:hypothetical protein